MARPLRLLLAALGAALALAGPAGAEDSGRPRYYLHLRAQDTNAFGVHDAWGVSLGANFNRYFGLELAGDIYELDFDPSGYGKIGEYSVFALLPQLRVRYPLLKDRLVPYLVGGVGVAFTEFNDRKPRGFGLAVDTESTVIVGSVGGGLEYFIDDNIAVGVEVKYLISGNQTSHVQGEAKRTDVNAFLTTVGLRVFYPELRPRPIAADYGDTRARFYLGVRAGAAILVGDPIDSGLSVDPEPAAYGNTGNQLFGFAVGADFGRHFGLELAFEGFETRLSVPGVGSIREYAVYSVLPQARLRYPLLSGALVTYLIGGVGVAFGESNDEKPRGATVSVGADSLGVAATVGAGVEYFVTRNVALNVETRYLFSRGHSIRVDGVDHKGAVDAMLVSLGLRAYLYDLKR